MSDIEKIIEQAEENFDKVFWDGIEAPETAKDISHQVKHFYRSFLSQAHNAGREEASEECRGAIDAVQQKMLKKARATDYADRTEYDECAEMLDSLLASLAPTTNPIQTK